MSETVRRSIFDVSWKTLFRIIVAVAVVWLFLELYRIVLLVLIAVVLAVTLNPIVVSLERRRWPRWGATLLVSLSLVAMVGGFLWLTWSSLNDQAQYASQHFREIGQQVSGALPSWIRDSIGSASGDAASTLGPFVLRVAQSVVSAIVVIVLGLFLTIYFLLEGRETRDWLVAFVPQRLRGKTEATLDRCEEAIFGYMAGNVATSVCAFVFALITLSVLKVPAALLMAVAAGLLDFVPVLGFILSSVPAIALAATVSGQTALIVAVLYAAYHAAENYLISPYVYGDRLKLSNVVIILAFAVGAQLAGVIGALIALPIAAIYPAIEAIWLRDTLGADTVKTHAKIEHRRAG